MNLAPFEIRTRPLRGTPCTEYTVVYDHVALGAQVSTPSIADCLTIATQACERGVINRAELARLRKIVALNDFEGASNVTLRLAKVLKTKDEAA